MSASEAIRDVIAPLLPGWEIQLGRWVDTGTNKRHAVVRPAGGALAELVRRPQFTLTLIGAQDDPIPTIEVFANQVIETMRATSGAIVFMQPGEPVYMATHDGRPNFEIAVSAITV